MRAGLVAPVPVWHTANKTETAEYMGSPPFDPRAVANVLLDEADDAGLSITNLALQKLIYFAHAINLMQTGKPLVSGYFEAWQYGPVHPSLYRAFRDSGAEPIRTRARGNNVLTGQQTDLLPPDDPEVRHFIRGVVRSYGRMSPGRLVDLAHAKGGPWDTIVHKARTGVAFGLRIPDDVIVQRFRYHIRPVGGQPQVEEPSEDTPPF